MAPPISIGFTCGVTKKILSDVEANYLRNYIKFRYKLCFKGGFLLNLEQQFQALIQEAPQFGVPSQVMEQAVVPALKLLAEPLQHSHYFLPQAADGSYILTTLMHRELPKTEKKVIYVFSTPDDASHFETISESANQIAEIQVIQLLFELMALKEVDSLIFMDNPGNLDKGTEISRSLLENKIQSQLKKVTLKQSSPKTQSPLILPRNPISSSSVAFFSRAF